MIIGYNEDPGTGIPSSFSPPLKPGDRGGSHNLVIGRWHRFTQAAFGGFVAGEFNVVSNQAASVSGGFDNIASGFRASLSGGFGNTASGLEASVTGGRYNTASGNTAVVLGGTNITDNNDNSIEPQPPFP